MLPKSVVDSKEVSNVNGDELQEFDVSDAFHNSYANWYLGTGQTFKVVLHFETKSKIVKKVGCGVVYVTVWLLLVKVIDVFGKWFMAFGGVVV